MSGAAFQRDVERFKAQRAAIESELRARIPNVCGVGIGCRQRRGQMTTDLVFRVYVDQKMGRTVLPVAQRVPALIAGFPTDVHTARRSVAQCKNHTRPLVAGIPMSSSAPFVVGQTGTLGCFVRVPPDNHIGALSNEHVLRTANMDKTDDVYQPTPGDCNRIGKSNQGTGVEANVQGVYVDAAVCDLGKVSYVNKLAKGAAYGDSGGTPVSLPGAVTAGSVLRNSKDQITEIRDGNGKVVDTTLIVDKGEAVLNSLVFKVGGETGLTVGYITSLTAVLHLTDKTGAPFDATGLIEVTAIAGFTDPQGKIERFTIEGDSGSVYMDLSNRIVGLHHHGGGKVSNGSPIDSVLSALGGLTIDTESGSDTHSTAASNKLAQAMWADVPLAGEEPGVLEERLRGRLSASPGGRAVLALVDAHVKEVLRLVWHRRAVTVAWHRHHGPAFVALFARAFARRTELPREAGGVSRAAALAAMADVLAVHGSSELRDAIRRARPWLFGPLAESKTIDELCGRLAEDAAAQ